MTTACSGIASPMRNRAFTERRSRPPPRTTANAAMNEMSTAGTTAPTVTTTQLTK